MAHHVAHLVVAVDGVSLSTRESLGQSLAVPFFSLHDNGLHPGNIGAWWKVEEVIKAVNDHGIPIRVGVNGGSLERHLLDKYGWPSPEALAESALNAVHALEDVGFTNMKVSLKASDVHHAIDAYWLFAQQSNYPLHIGITEAGTAMTGAVKSAMGLGFLLSQGVGDTLRVSLAADPVEEVKVGYEILKSLELRHRGINVIACPTCGRVEIDVVRMANELEKKLGHIKTPLNVSVLGCVVNGIGEGKEADIGIAGGEGKGILFKKGKLVRKVPMDQLMDTLIHEVEILAKEKEAEGNGAAVAHSNEGWELLPSSDQSPTLGKEIPVLSNKH